MKTFIKKVTLPIFLLGLFSFTLLSDGVSTLPSADLKTMDGKAFNTLTMHNGSNPIVISFWATWCKPCILELNTIHEDYAAIQKETGVKLYAISIDDSKSASRVKPFVDGSGWNYEVLLDINSDFKRKMNVVNPPQTFVLDSNKNIIWQHQGFMPGDEEELYKVLRSFAK